MKLKRFLLRYYPPGIILEYELRDGTREMKEIDLLHLTAEYVEPRHHCHCGCSIARPLMYVLTGLVAHGDGQVGYRGAGEPDRVRGAADLRVAEAAAAPAHLQCVSVF